MLVFVAVYIFTGVVFVACGADKGNDTAGKSDRQKVTECNESTGC
jgi:hypothetical protein